MKNLLIILFVFPLVTLAQFSQPTGKVIGNQTVISIPVNPPGYGTVQALAYFPDDYFLPQNANKRYPLYVFLHGAGEGTKWDITEVTNTSLPQEIAQGLKPYAIGPAGDTVKFIVISPHCATCNGSYSFPQLRYTIPYLFQAYRVDTSCVFVGGLSSGGSCSWSMAMGNAFAPSSADTLTTNRITGIMPMANGGYDNNITVPVLKNNLIAWLKSGHKVIYTIGDLDAGYNAIGYFTYSKLDSLYGLPGNWYHKVVVGSPHDATVWNPPFALTNRWYSPTMNVWQLMWSLRKNAGTVTPPIPATPHAVITLDSSIINYPNSVVHVSASKSYETGGTIAADDWTEDIGASPVIFTQSDSVGVCISGLRPGTYRFKLTVTDGNGLKDSTYAAVQVNGPVIPICPICPPPVVCPAPRTVTGILISINGLTFAIPLTGTKITFSDGSTQP